MGFQSLRTSYRASNRTSRCKLTRTAVAASVGAATVSLAVATRGDTVTLKTGGIVRGSIVAAPAGSGAKAVAVRTPTGGLVVVEQQAVQQVNRAGKGALKTVPKAVSKSSPKAASKVAAKNRPSTKRLTPEEEAWFPKVRALVDHLSSSDANKSRRARGELLAIDDSNAIPALTRYLGKHPNENVRELYVAILGKMSGPKPAYWLVAESLFDPTPQVREKARKAIGADRADAARGLYIEALKYREPNLASLAAKGITEIGDPRGEAVPYLIDVLVFYTRQEVAANAPGFALIPFVPELTDAGPQPGFAMPSSPNAVNSLGFGGAQTPSMGGSSAPRTPLGGSLPFWLGEINVAANYPGWSPAAKTYATDSSKLDKYLPKGGDIRLPGIIAQTPVSTRTIKALNVNTAVHDALLKISDQRLGFNPDHWRRWWQVEKLNRERNGKVQDGAEAKSPDAR